MDAGRELDALVAEKVMGMLTTIGGDIYGTGDKTHYMRPSVNDRWDNTPRYSTDIAAAWQVVEHLHGQAVWSFDLRTRPRQYYYEFELTRSAWPRSPQRYIAHAHTAPHAICLAALRAVGAIE